MPDSYYDQSYASIIFHTLLHSNHEGMCTGGEGGGEKVVLLGILGGVCYPVLQILTLFQTKKCHFYTHFQNWPLKAIPVSRPGL